MMRRRTMRMRRRKKKKKKETEVTDLRQQRRKVQPKETRSRSGVVGQGVDNRHWELGQSVFPSPARRHHVQPRLHHVQPRPGTFPFGACDKIRSLRPGSFTN